MTLNPLISGGQTPSGQRNWISFSGGSWSGSFGSGVVVLRNVLSILILASAHFVLVSMKSVNNPQPGGQDSQIIHPNLTAELMSNCLLQTNDTTGIHQHQGERPPEVFKSLMDPSKASGVDPRSYKFRLFTKMGRGDERYREKVNFGMWLES